MPAEPTASAPTHVRRRLLHSTAEDWKSGTLAGDAVVSKLNLTAPSGEALGGLKVETENGWFAIRPSGTEDICKLYAESFRSEHLTQILSDAAAWFTSLRERRAESGHQPSRQHRSGVGGGDAEGLPKGYHEPIGRDRHARRVDRALERYAEVHSKHGAIQVRKQYA